MIRLFGRGPTEARETLLLTVPLVLSVVLCGAIAWLTLLSEPGEVEASPLDEDQAADERTAPDRDTDPRVFIAGETQ